jgi:glycosyltransferase involved in cell wall biosynthesis
VVEHETGLLKKSLSKAILKKGDFFIVHSGDDLLNLKEIIPDAKVSQFFLPFIPELENGLFEKEKALNVLGLEAPCILFFGIIRPYKGIDFLIRAMPDILREMDIRLLIVGEVWGENKEIENLIKGLGLEEKIRLILKFIPSSKIPLYFSASDLLCLPYTSATGSGVLQIAQSLKKPVIATDVGSFRNVIVHGKTGFLVPPQNSGALAEAVIRFYREKKEEEFSKNIEKEREKYSWENMVKLIENFF